MTKNFRPCLLAALAVSLAFSLPARAAIGPAENLLPTDTLAFFTVPDCAALRTAFKTSPGAMFWNDPAMKPFHDKFMSRLSESFLAPLEKDLGISVADFLSLPQGQFTLAVTANGSNGHDDVPPGLLLLLDAKGQGDLLKTNLATLTKKWTESGRSLRTEKINGLAFTVVPLSTNDLPAIFASPAAAAAAVSGDRHREIYFTQYQTLLLAGNSAKAVAAVASRLTGGSAPALADDAGFAADKLSQFRNAPTYYGWFNGAKFFGALLAAGVNLGDPAAASLQSTFTTAKILGATGLGGLKSASFALREQAEGSYVSFHITAPEDTRTGILKIFALPGKDAGIPAFVPANAVKFTRVRLDGNQAWASLQKTLAEISPQYLASLNSVVDVANTLAQAKNPAFDLRTYLFANLRDDLITYQKPPTSDSPEAYANPPVLYLVAVGDADQAIDAARTLAGMSAPQDGAAAPRDFLGHKIYTVALRTATAGAAGSQPGSLFVTSGGGYLGISKNAGILEEYLRSADGKAKSLRDAPGMAEAAGQVGGMGGGLFSYENQRETMRSAFKLLKTTSGDATIASLPAALRDWMDFSLLPDFGPLAKYFYLSVFAASANADGLTLKTFTPRPPELD